MYATQSAIRSVPKGDSASNAIKSLTAIHQITGQYLNKKGTQADYKNTSPNSDREIEAFSILTQVKQLLASSGLQDGVGVVTPPDSGASLPEMPPSNKRNISPLTLQPAAIHSTPRHAGKPSGSARPPQEAIMGLFAQMSAASAINLFEHWGVFDAIPVPQEVSGAGAEISFADLAKKVNVEEALLSKLRPPSRV